MSTLADRLHYVYRLYSADGTLVYIGATHDVQTRLYHLLHACNAGKHPTGELRRIGVARYTAAEYPNRAAAFAAEREAIRREQPLLNVQSSATPAPTRAVAAADVLRSEWRGGNTVAEFAEYLGTRESLHAYAANLPTEPGVA